MTNETLELEFWKRVSKDGPGDCWRWTGRKCSFGYGRVRETPRHKDFQAHRVSYELAHGPIPNGMWVLHKCDNAQCTNPEHLFLGTNADNVADKVAKGRQSKLKGSAHGRAKLTEDQALAIRAAQGVKDGVLALQFNVSEVTIWKVRTGRSWRHI